MRGRHETAKKCRSFANRVLRYAAGTERCSPFPDQAYTANADKTYQKFGLLAGDLTFGINRHGIPILVSSKPPAFKMLATASLPHTRLKLPPINLKRALQHIRMERSRISMRSSLKGALSERLAEYRQVIITQGVVKSLNPIVAIRELSNLAQSLGRQVKRFDTFL